MQGRFSSAELAASGENHSQLALVKQALLRHETPSVMGWNRRQTSVRPLILCYEQCLKSQASSLVIDSTHNMIRSASVKENCTWIIWQKDNGPCSLNVKHCMNNIKVTLLWALHVTRHYYTESSPNSLSSFWSTDPRNCNKALVKKPTHFYFNITTEIRISLMTKCHTEIFQCRFE